MAEKSLSELREETVQHLGDDVRHVPDPQERRGAQETVHGPAEAGAAPGGEEDGRAPPGRRGRPLLTCKSLLTE